MRQPFQPEVHDARINGTVNRVTKIQPLQVGRPPQHLQKCRKRHFATVQRYTQQSRTEPGPPRVDLQDLNRLHPNIRCRWQILRLVPSIQCHPFKVNPEQIVQPARPIDNLPPPVAGHPHLQNRRPVQQLKDLQPQFRRKKVFPFIRFDGQPGSTPRTEPKQSRFGGIGREQHAGDGTVRGD
uniref:(northern house mosquito) hypothetical protein n=1 Tax=Culex pipiens TaxID=7175 RepID=A0A8D8CG30_CULPI